MATSASGKALVIKAEGRRNEMYHDQLGKPTIGIGHLLTEQELLSGVLTALGVDWRLGLTDEQVDLLFQSDIRPVEDTINDNVSPQLSQNQFDALVSFVFNIGRTAFITSATLTVINRGELDQAPSHMEMWVHGNVGGVEKVIPDLVERRAKEVALWKTA